ncbi:MAG: FG-GAP repeat domain-containing protein [Verrucomicrobiia bacterium]
MTGTSIYLSPMAVPFGLPALANYLYRNDGSDMFTKITSGSVVEDVEQSLGAAWGDYDNDGHLDLFVAIIQELREVAANHTLSVTEPPRLEAPSIGRIRIHCWKGQKFEAEVSNDLLTWTSLGVMTNETQTLEVTDGDAASHPYRFYRAKSQ